MSVEQSPFFWLEKRELERPPLSSTWPNSQVSSGYTLHKRRWAPFVSTGANCVFHAGHRLRVVNMNQQSDTADLLGG